MQALKKILTLGKRLEKPVGILMSTIAPRQPIEMGFDYFHMTGDADLMTQAARAMLSSTKHIVRNAKE
jgi:hypothetical protein